MNKRIFRIGIVIGVGLMGIGTAQGKSIETFHEEFRRNTGKEWIDATAEEKRSFVQDYYHIKEEAIREGKEKLYYGNGDGGSQAPLSIESTLEVQRLFERKGKKSWEEATSEEQKAFLEEYNKKYQEGRERQRMREEKIARAEETRKREEEMAKQRLERLEEQKEREKLKEKDRREKDRKQSRKKLQDALEKFRKKRQWNSNDRDRK